MSADKEKEAFESWCNTHDFDARVFAQQGWNARAALEAMQVREMTVEEVAEVLYRNHSPYGNGKGLALYIDDAKALAKLGTIRIVGD